VCWLNDVRPTDFWPNDVPVKKHKKTWVYIFLFRKNSSDYAMTNAATTLSIMEFGILGLLVTLSTTTLCHYDECRYADCRILLIVMRNDVAP
jgi:hypothetical protein